MTRAQDCTIAVGGSRQTAPRARCDAVMIPRLVSILIVGCVAACGTPAPSVENSVALHLDQVSARVAEVAAEAGIPVERGAVVSTARGDGGAAVFLPSAHEDGRLVGWLQLPPANPCAARLPAGFYAVDVRLTAEEAFLTLREIDGSARLADLRSNLERFDDEDAPSTALARIALDPEQFLLGSWVKCSDGVGCCRWVLTLDSSTPGCS